eukprot:395147-Hanusia_phi.AAC.1
MDSDTQGLGLDFGPNTFSMEGGVTPILPLYPPPPPSPPHPHPPAHPNLLPSALRIWFSASSPSDLLMLAGRFVQARLENVSAKEFIFNVRSGELLAMDLGTLT